MGDCSVEIRIMIGLAAFGVALIWIGVAVTWTAAIRVLRASRAALLEITLWKNDRRSAHDLARLEGPAPKRRA